VDAGARLDAGARGFQRLGPDVSSYALDDGERLLLFDPLALPGEIEARAADRETAIVLICPWHRRDALDLAERLGVPIFVLVLPTHGAPTD
jgi:hypothetical protein